jgi:nucleotide-binding universal stress UspA family protein
MTASTDRGSTDSGRVVVGFDGSEAASHAVHWAARKAARRGTDLRIVTAFGSDFAFTDNEEFDSTAAKLSDRAVREAGEVAPGLTVEYRSARDLPTPVLRQESEDAGLLVVGSRGRGGFSGLLLGSVSRQCVHRSHCPVVVIRPSDNRDSATQQSDLAPGLAPLTRRIVVGVDGSPSSTAALTWAAEEAESTGATLELIHTWEWMASSGWAMVPSNFDPREDARTVLNQAADPVRLLFPGLELTTRVVEGRASDALTRASLGAELLAVGCRGHGEASGMVLGSVSDYCVTHASCPVLIMRGTTAGDPRAA